MKRAPDPTRTTPTGLFHYAEAYRTCAEALMRAPPKTLRFEDPMWFLTYHSIELYLKAYLLNRGVTLGDLKHQFKHGMRPLWERATAEGLATKRDPSHVFATLDAGGLLAHRYIVTGTTQRPNPTDVMEFAEELRVQVFTSLRAFGHPVAYEDHTVNGWGRG